MSTEEEKFESLFSDFSFSGIGENDEPEFEMTQKDEQDEDHLDGDENVAVDDEGKNKDDKAPSKASKSSSSSSIKVLAKVLSEEGVLSSFKEDTNLESAEDLISLIQGEIDGRVNKYKDTLPDEIKDLVERYDEGVDIYELIKIRGEQKDISRVTEEMLEDNDSLKKEILTRDLREQGMSDEDISEEIEDIFSIGKDDLKARKALSRIKGRLKQREAEFVRTEQAREENAKKEYQNRLKEIKTSMEGMKEFAGVTLSTKLKEEAFRAMTVPVAEIDGTPVNAIVKSRMENPQEFDKSMALIWTLTKGFKSFDGLMSSAKKSAIRELEEEAERLAANQPVGIPPHTKKNLSQSETVLRDINLNNIL